MSTLMERVARLEERADARDAVLDALLSEVREIHSEMTRYKGFLGGVTFLGACCVTALTLFKEWIIAHVK